MDEIEKFFDARKEEIEHIQAPDELEQRLNKALKDRTSKNRKRWFGGKIAAACVVCLLLAYNFDTLAYYSGKIIGYSEVMNGTLAQLNEFGKGQIVDKSYTFKNGVNVTVDAIMMDETQLIAFYTIENPKGDVDDIVMVPDLAGKQKRYNSQSGQGILNEDETTLKWVESFEPLHFSEKTLTFSFSVLEDITNEKGEITFDIDRKKAMGHTLKAKINKSVELDKGKIYFDTILAAPTRTVITGKIQNILELALDEVKNERLRPKGLEIKLIANDKEIGTQSSGMRTDMKGISFDVDYDALPEKLESLKLEVLKFTSDHDVNEVISLDREVAGQKFELLQQDLIINKIYEVDGKTYINITTQEDTIFTKLYLLDGDKKIELNKTIEDQYEKTEEGKSLHTRTLEFGGIAKTYKLDIKTMTYSKEYNQVIELPIK
jgi:hypothetical protein